MKRSKKCKVKYVDNLETDFKVNYAEIKVKIKYKIYGKPETGGYQLLATKDDEKKAIDYAENQKKHFDSVLVIKHDELTNTDFPIDFER